jgi:hypothetical protein
MTMPVELELAALLDAALVLALLLAALLDAALLLAEVVLGSPPAPLVEALVEPATAVVEAALDDALWLTLAVVDPPPAPPPPVGSGSLNV